MGILSTRKAVWSLAVMLLVAGLAGVYGQGSQQTGTDPAPGTAGKPVEVPLGTGAPATADLDLQLPATGGEAPAGGMTDIKMGMEMTMKSPMAGMGVGGISVKETEVVQISPRMGPMAGMGNMARMAGMPGMGTAAAPAAAPGGELSGQLLATNALLTQLLSTLASQPGGIQAAQLQTVNQLLANQAALLQLLLKSGSAAPSASAAPAAPAGSGGMSGMSGM